MKKYNVHIELANQTIKAVTKNNLIKLINLEQDIVSGLDSTGKKINNTTLVKEISQISKDLSQTDYLRLLMQYFACFDLSPKDKDTMLKSIPNESHRIILQNMEYLDADMAHSKKFRRRKEEMTTEEFNEYARKLSQCNLEITRCQTKICKLIKKVHDCQLDTKDYPYIDKPKAKKTNNIAGKTKGAIIANGEFDKQDIMENPRIFVYVIGGLSHNEITSIANLQSTINAQIIPGSDSIITTKQYLEQLERIHRKDSESVLKQSSMADVSQDLDLSKTGLEDDDFDEDDDDDDGGYAINK